MVHSRSLATRLLIDHCLWGSRWADSAKGRPYGPDSAPRWRRRAGSRACTPLSRWRAYHSRSMTRGKHHPSTLCGPPSKRTRAGQILQLSLIDQAVIGQF